MNNMKQSDKIFKTMVKLLKLLIILILILAVVIFFVNKQIEKQKEQLANATLPQIEERIDKIIDANPDIYEIVTDFNYKSTNLIMVYVSDTWFNTTDINKKRFTKDIRDNVKAIMIEEGFIQIDDRLGIYVYTKDRIALAESDMYGEIKLKD